MKPAILQLIPNLDTGGAERSTIDMAAAIAAAGFTSLVASEGGRMEAELGYKGGKLIRLPMASKSPLTIYANAAKLEELIAKSNVKLIHARSRAPAWSGLIAARRAKIAFITTHHGHYSAKNMFKRWYNSVMVRGDAVIANSSFTAQHIAHEYGRMRARIVTIPRGLDDRMFSPEAVPEGRVASFRESWGAAPGDLVILLPGRLTRWKGQLVLIGALAQLPPETPSFRAVLAGDAQGREDYVAELRAAIADAGLAQRVHIAGHVHDMAAAYLAADIVVSASTDAEAFGRVAAEAAAMGRPVIATDHGGARETVLDGRSGVLTPPGDAAALAGALTKLIAMGREGRARLGDAGRAHVLSRFTREAMCAATIALYEELVGEVFESADR